MVDLHSHYLYGVDDGADSPEIALDLLSQAEYTGISKLLATPHVNAHTTSEAENKILHNFTNLSGLVEEKNIPVQIRLAAEVNFIGSDIDWLDHDWVLIGGEKQRYILVETPFQQMPADYSEILFRIRLKKIIPILAHPERNMGFQENPQQLIEWIYQGAIVQLDAGSIIGQFGKGSQRFSERLLKAGAVHVVASDAHNLKGRNYTVLKNAYRDIEENFGLEKAENLFVQNPGRIWEGSSIKSGIENESLLDPTFGEKLRKIFTGR